MKPLLNSLLLLCLCTRSTQGVSSGTPVVTQSPDVSVREGETLNITCCWTGEFERGTVNWLKNKTLLDNKLISNKDNVQGSLKKRSVCFNLTFLNITRKDSGSYTCNLAVELPAVFVAEGNSTVITVTDREDTFEDAAKEDKPEGLTNGMLVWVHVLRCLPLLALIVTFFCINRWATKAQQPTSDPGKTRSTAQRVEEEEGREEEEIRAEYDDVE
ncbi:uncharacterized protein LOC132958208 isoform X2 [Labrus mixtus]|uniref:uncharacterized protein LOC132958208 isoform X2 n=1 Tax=Labrus mixtus TaxID=508554 RepID=UPI0029C0FF3A|nr:uncharacterized protein LOC132958208 isoform X2 [Labrus mixtus]